MTDTRSELDVLRQLVDERKRNEDRLRSNVGRLHAIVETQQEISALELDREAVTNTLVLRAQRLTGADGAAVQWFEGHESVFHHCTGIAARHVGLRMDRSTSLEGARRSTARRCTRPMRGSTRASRTMRTSAWALAR